MIKTKISSELDVVSKNLFTQSDWAWLLNKYAPEENGLSKKDNAKFQEAVEYFLDGDYSQSCKIFKKLHQSASKQLIFTYGYVICEFAEQNPRLEEILQKKLSGETNSPFYYYILGMMKENENDYFHAIEFYSIAKDKDEEFAPAIFRLAYLADLRGDEEEALELYEHCRQNHYNYPNLLNNLGNLYEDLMEPEKALKCFEHMLEIDPTNKRAKLFLADVHASLSMYVDDDKERENSQLKQILATPISDFELSVRSRNCLNKMKIRTLGDLIEKSEAELLSYKNFGETSLAEIKEILSKKGLKLGMGLEDKNLVKKKEKREKKPASISNNQDLYDMPISALELSVRSKKCLINLDIKSVGELVSKQESELLLCKNFGITSLQEIKKKLTEFGLNLSNN